MGFFFAFIFVNIIICKYLYINLRIENKKTNQNGKEHLHRDVLWQRQEISGFTSRNCSLF
jgi:hypothetical protein